MARGECNCGSVAFEVKANLTDVYVCHCSICRRSTGANGIAVVVVDNAYFQWTIGEKLVSTWKKPGHDYQLWFCSRCGSPLPGKNSDSSMFVPAGLISEGGEYLKVAHHIWVQSKASWDQIADSGQQHLEAIQT